MSQGMLPTQQIVEKVLSEVKEAPGTDDLSTSVFQYQSKMF